MSAGRSVNPDQRAPGGIVRADTRCPTLIVGAAPAPGAADVVRLLAAEAADVIAADGGATVCLEAGVTPDVVIGDFDSLDATTAAALRSKAVDLVAHPSDKDRTDLSLACELARARHARGLRLTCAYANRMDHTIAALGVALSAADLSPEIVEPAWRGWILSANARSTLELEANGATVSVIALGGVARVSATGVRWPLERATLAALSDLGVSNIGSGERTCIVVHEGAVLVTLLVDNAQR